MSATVPVLCRYLAVACVDVVSLWSVETGQVVRSIVPEGVSEALCLSCLVLCVHVTDCTPSPCHCSFYRCPQCQLLPQWGPPRGGVREGPDQGVHQLRLQAAL